MNKIAQGLIGATAAILLLAGCSAVSAEAQGVPSVAPSATASSESSASPSSTPSASPGNTDPSSNQWNGFASQRDWYLRSLDGALSGNPPSEDQLIAAGNLACKQLNNGKKIDAVRVVTGTGPSADLDNRNIVEAARMVYCPDAG